MSSNEMFNFHVTPTIRPIRRSLWNARESKIFSKPLEHFIVHLWKIKLPRKNLLSTNSDKRSPLSVLPSTFIPRPFPAQQPYLGHLPPWQLNCHLLWPKLELKYWQMYCCRLVMNRLLNSSLTFPHILTLPHAKTSKNPHLELTFKFWLSHSQLPYREEKNEKKRLSRKKKKTEGSAKGFIVMHDTKKETIIDDTKNKHIEKSENDCDISERSW